jgi:hypothetical protein
MPNWHVADPLDFEDRAEHLRRLLLDVEVYVKAVMQDMKAYLPRTRQPRVEKSHIFAWTRPPRKP